MKSALIAAIVAAIVSASAATATTAVVITGAQIKNGTVQVADLSPKARAALKGQRGPRGPAGAPGGQGPAGAPGAQGPAGAAGGFNPAKVNFRVGAETVIVGGSVANHLTATCAAGETAIAGGYFADIGTAYFDGPAGNRTSWTVSIDAFDYTSNGSGWAYAICAAA